MKLPRIFLVIIFISLTAISCSGPFGSQATSAGIAKTSNGGLDWMLSNTVVVSDGEDGKKPETNNAISDTDVSVIRFEPGNSQRLYAATLTDGVYYSQDSGENWKQILSDITVYDLVIDPRNIEHIYVAGTAGGNGKVLETKDKGKSWVVIYNEVTRQNPVKAIAINPANVKDIIIGSQSGNIIKSLDAGQTWGLVQNFGDPVVQVSWADSGLYVLSETRGLYVSTTGGARFEDISKLLLDFKNRASGSLGAESPLINVDVPQTAIREFRQFGLSSQYPGVIYVVTDNGLYKTFDGGEAWVFVKLPLKSGGFTAGVSSVSLGTSDSIVYVGVGNTVYKSLNRGESWQVQSIATDAIIQYILIDSRLSQVAYIGLNGGHR